MSRVWIVAIGGTWCRTIDIRIWIPIQAQQIHIDARRRPIPRRASQSLILIQCKTGPVCILIRVEEDIRAVVFVVTIVMISVFAQQSTNNCQPLRFTHSLAQRYGSSARIFGRAHLDRSKGDVVLGDMTVRLWWGCD
jgi:hypothetical protein